MLISSMSVQDGGGTGQVDAPSAKAYPLCQTEKPDMRDS